MPFMSMIFQVLGYLIWINCEPNSILMGLSLGTFNTNDFTQIFGHMDKFFDQLTIGKSMFFSMVFT